MHGQQLMITRFLPPAATVTADQLSGSTIVSCVMLWRESPGKLIRRCGPGLQGDERGRGAQAGPARTSPRCDRYSLDAFSHQDLKPRRIELVRFLSDQLGVRCLDHLRERGACLKAHRLGLAEVN